MMRAPIHDRIGEFCKRFGLRVPIMLSPMGGVTSTSLPIAVASAGGLAACGVVLMSPDQITAWSDEVRRNTNGIYQLNNWIPDPAPVRDAAREAAVREFLEKWGPAIPPEAGDVPPPDFKAQFEAMLAARPPIISSIMGLYPPDMVQALKKRNIKWFATASTVAEAKAAEAAGADVIVAQGVEAGGHRGSFKAETAERTAVGLFALLPAVVDAVNAPVVAAGGIADGRSIAAALILGASAVQIGTGFLRCPEAKVSPAWADALQRALPEDTVLSRTFSGRTGRTIATDYVKAATSPNAPTPAPYPVQLGLTARMRAAASEADDISGIAAWAGQSAARARSIPAETLITELWKEASALLA